MCCCVRLEALNFLFFIYDIYFCYIGKLIKDFLAFLKAFKKIEVSFSKFPFVVDHCFHCAFCILGIVGEIGEGGDTYYIWTHKKFEIGYNGKQIVDVNLTSEVKVKLEPKIKLVFTYQVCSHIYCF